MEADRLDLLEQKFKQIIKAAAYFQTVAILIAASILYLKPPAYQEIGQSFSILALCASFAISRWYIYTGKKIEKTKTLSQEECASIKKSFLIRFFSPYVLWVASMWIFSQ